MGRGNQCCSDDRARDNAREKRQDHEWNPIKRPSKGHNKTRRDPVSRNLNVFYHDSKRLSGALDDLVEFTAETAVGLFETIIDPGIVRVSGKPMGRDAA